MKSIMLIYTKNYEKFKKNNNTMSLQNLNQEFTFCFDEEPESQQENYQFEFKFLDSDSFNNYYSKSWINDIDQENHPKQARSTHESTSSERREIDYNLDELAPWIVSFIDNQPNLNELEQIVSDQIRDKGYNLVVLDWLDISTKEDSEENRDIIRKKQKKSRGQIRALKAEFKKRQNWNKRYMKKLAKELGLRVEQVYKWHWDQTNKSKSCQSDTSSESYKRMRTSE